MEYCELSLYIVQKFSQLFSIFKKIVEIQPILDNIWQISKRF